MPSQRILIDLTGETEADLQAALDEALARYRAGNVMGFDSNETSRFNFTVDNDPQDPEPSEAPAPAPDFGLVEYLLGQAPKEIPSWFRPTFPHIPADPPAPERPPEIAEAIAKWEQDACYDLRAHFEENEAIGQKENSALVDLADDYQAKREAWNHETYELRQQRTLARQFAWPWHWARQLAAARDSFKA